jgi:DNA modification methylase
MSSLLASTALTSSGVNAALSIVQRPIATLKPDPKNPRKHSPKQIGQIAESIRTFGFNVPVLVDKDLKVIAGHGRILACQRLGWDSVPTIQLEHLTPAQARAYMIADNRLTEIAAWDDRVLAEQLKELSTLDLDFSLEVTGFDMGEIDLRISGLDEAQEPDEADAVPEPVGPAISRLGDLWLLGDNRLICGNALEPSTYEALMAGTAADMAFTDPPYNVRIKGHASGLGTVVHREFPMASGEMDEAAFTGFLAESFRLFAQHSREGSVHFICMDWRHIRELLAAGAAVYGQPLNLCVWVKDNGGMGSLYRSQHELVFVFKNGAARHRNNVQLGRHGRYRTNVWEYPGVNSFARQGEEGNLLDLHPTVKPVALVADAILDCSARGELVLDAFAGSGTTLIAAEKTGRRCNAIELDPLYVDTAIRRWQTLTGEQARRANDDKAFDALVAEVAHD